MTLKEYLAEKKITIADAAKQIGVCEATLNRYFAFQSFPSRRIQKKICGWSKGAVRASDFLEDYQNRGVF